jgi:glycogen debranching enzyme
VLAGIVSWHEQGTRYGIRVDDDGLLLADEDGVQLTWMDAQVGDWVVTPRQGKAVEIQALWYNALRTMGEVSELLECGEPAHYRKLADRAKASFAKLFWNAEAGCLYDTVDGDSRSASIRPNQIFAVSLFHSMVSRERAVRIVEVVERHLLTTFGLRSLAPSDPQYRGRYEGGPQTRDTAYRQGTVWSWLMGPFVSAYLRVHGRSAESRAQVAGWLWTSQSFMDDEGTGQLPEVFDGDGPHRPVDVSPKPGRSPNSCESARKSRSRSREQGRAFELRPEGRRRRGINRSAWSLATWRCGSCRLPG